MVNVSLRRPVLCTIGEDQDEMLHNAPFHQGLHCLLRQNSIDVPRHDGQWLSGRVLDLRFRGLCF